MAIDSKSGIQRFYSDPGVATGYIGERFTSELHRLLHDRQVAAVNEIIKTTRPKRILEIAPGPGRITKDIHYTGTLACLEYSPAMIEAGRRASSGNARWVRGDGFEIPFGPHFDFVYTFRFIRHFHRTERLKIYAAVKAALKPGGYFVMDAVNEKVSMPIRKAHPEQYAIYDKLYRFDELRTELQDAGLPLAKLLPVQKCFSWQYQSQVLLGPRANWLNRLVIRTVERLPSVDGLEWIVTCRRS